MLTAMLVALLFLGSFFELAAISFQSGVILAFLMIACPTLFLAFVFIFDRQMLRHDNKTAKK